MLSHRLCGQWNDARTWRDNAEEPASDKSELRLANRCVCGRPQQRQKNGCLGPYDREALDNVTAVVECQPPRPECQAEIVNDGFALGERIGPPRHAESESAGAVPILAEKDEQTQEDPGCRQTKIERSPSLQRLFERT